MFIPTEHDKIPLVIIDNFLPTDYINSLYVDFEKLKDSFNISHWTNGIGEEVKPTHSADDPLNPLCLGEDVWLPFGATEDDNKNIGNCLKNLSQYLFHQGILEFLKNSKHYELKSYAEFFYDFKYHIVNYKNGGYYNWHTDGVVRGPTFAGNVVEKRNVFTFALTLVKNTELIKGGDQYFMYKNDIHVSPLKNNQLTIFPSTVYHSCSEIFAPEDLSWENRRFNIQAWLCHI